MVSQQILSRHECCFGGLTRAAGRLLDFPCPRIMSRLGAGMTNVNRATRNKVRLIMLAVEVDWNLLRQYGGTMAGWQWAIMLVVGCVAVWSMFRLRAWFREDDGRADGNLEMLTQFRDLHRQGDLSEDEYRLIKSRLVRQQASPTRADGRPTESAKSAGELPSTLRKVGAVTAGEGESRLDDKPPTMVSASASETTQTETDESGRNPDSSH